MNTEESLGIGALAGVLIFVLGMLVGSMFNERLTIEECLKVTATSEIKKGEL